MKYLNKTFAIVLLSMVSVVMICINLDWQQDNKRLQKIVDKQMQEVADIKEDYDVLLASYDRKCADIAELEARSK